MTLLPIVERELRVASRRRGTYWARAAIVLLATIVGIVTFMASLVIPAAKFGTLLFWGLSGISMIYCLMAGRQMTADCLSEEKREGTFGLLFLTDLKGYDVVLGKLFARSFNGFYGLIATIPVLAIPLLVGGMTYGEFWRMVVVLVDTFLFTLAVGMFVSAISSDYQQVMGRNFAVLLLTTTLFPVCAGALLVWQPSKPLRAELLFPCPVFAFALCSDALCAKTPEQFWSSVGVIHGMTWMLIILACSLAPRSLQDKPVPARSETSPEGRSWRWWSEGNLEKRNAFREKLLNQNAYYWLAGRPYVKPAWVWTLLVLVACWMVRTAAAVGHFEETVCITGALLVNGALKLWIGLEAGHQLAGDQKSGAYELLLSTPLTVRDILRGQLLALVRQFLKPLMVVMAVELIFMLLLARPGYHSVNSSEQIVWIWTAGIVMLAADAAALSVFAMASALTAKSYTQASMRTVRCILVLPWILYGAAYLIMDLFLDWWPNASSYLSWKYELAMWFGLGIAVDVLYAWRAWHRLRTDFREMALRAYAPPPTGFSERWRRRMRSVIGAVWTEPNLDGPRDPRARLKKALIIGAAILTGVCLLLISRDSSYRGPKPVTVSLGPNNTTLRIFSAQDGVLFVLPDGSLWRWGKMDGQTHVRASIPQRVGTDSDWVEVSSCGKYTIGRRTNGTVWEWDANTEAPRQVDLRNDWVQIGGGYNFSVILKRDGTLWAWGNNSAGQLGRPASGSAWNYNAALLTNITQIGTNSDWKAISTPGQSTLALRKNGTLWAWGNLAIYNSMSAMMTPSPIPTQACRETNWVSISVANPNVARNQAGELWDVRFWTAPPSPSAPASLVFNQIGAGSTSANPAFGIDYEARSIRARLAARSVVRYEVRANGTLWAAPLNGRFFTLSPAQKWKQIGKRHDWISVWGDFGTVVALTADGTVWTWGTDWSHEPTRRYPPRLQALGQRVQQIFGGPVVATGYSAYDVQNEPRPLMRLVPGPSSHTNRAAR